MSDQEVAEIMCESILTKSDIKEICKARGISSKETMSKTHFENFFLSHIGVAEVIKTLSQEEIIFLNYLVCKEKEVDITFLKNINLTDTRGYSFTERYKNLFTEVKSTLIRKGILLIREDDFHWDKKSKLEKYRFSFPSEFYQFLPPLVSAPSLFDVKEKSQAGEMREKFMEIVNADKKSHAGKKSNADSDNNVSFHIDKELYFGDVKYNYSALKKWQTKEWCNRIKIEGDKNEPIKAIKQGLSNLNKNEWASIEDLMKIVKIFCSSPNLSGWFKNTEVICDAGSEWGVLDRHIDNNRKYFRLAEEIDANNYSDYLKKNSNGYFIIDLEKIPYKDFDTLLEFSRVSIENQKLILRPDFIKIGQAYGKLSLDPLFTWVYDNSTKYNETINRVKERSFKQVVHSDLVVARIRDLSLKVKIEKELFSKNKVISLSKEFIAFPEELTQQIEKIVNKSGHVVNRK